MRTPPQRAFDLLDAGRSYRTGFWLRRRPALTDVTLGLEHGQFLGLVGANGSGKSTLLRLLAGIERPDRGKATVFGEAAHRPAARARVGYLPEGSPWPPELALAAALELLLALRGFGRAEARRTAGEALDRAGLGAERTRPLGRCSSGQRRRFGLAQAFAHRPDLVLLDEPTVGLDAPGLDVLAHWLCDVRARGASAVVCSHRPADLFGTVDRLAQLQLGRLVADGQSAAFLAAARHVELELRTKEPLTEEELRRRLGDVELLGVRPAASALLDLDPRTSDAADPSRGPSVP